MKYLLIVLLSLSACKSCPEKQVTVDFYVEKLAGHFHCGNTEQVRSDIEDIAEDMDFCGDFTASAYNEQLPAGVWSHQGICCFSMISSILIKDSWSCKKEFHPEVFLEECQSL